MSSTEITTASLTVYSYVTCNVEMRWNAFDFTTNKLFAFRPEQSRRSRFVTIFSKFWILSLPVLSVAATIMRSPSYPFSVSLLRLYRPLRTARRPPIILSPIRHYLWLLSACLRKTRCATIFHSVRLPPDRFFQTTGKGIFSPIIYPPPLLKS